jgi:hypothetical protein
VKERGILFSSPMVRALLAGTKTQTRRLVKHREFGASDTPGYDWTYRATPRRGGCWNDVSTSRMLEQCPYGAAGERLWVRETHAISGQLVAYEADGWAGAVCDDGGGGRLRIPHGFVFTSAADEKRRGSLDKDGGRFGIDRFGGRWRPSIHLPRWASRITLEVIGVRVERVQDISEDDARAEGVRPFFEVYAGIGRDQRITSGEYARDAEHRAAFACLWDEINGDRALWSSNPWVWVVDFRRTEPSAIEATASGSGRPTSAQSQVPGR